MCAWLDAAGERPLFSRTGARMAIGSYYTVRVTRGEDTVTLHGTPSHARQPARLGVKATLQISQTRDISGTLDFSGAGELGIKLLARAKIEGSASGTRSSSKTTDTEPIGQTAADLPWVAQTIIASNRRLVLEDFHYLSEETQREFAFILKALGNTGYLFWLWASGLATTCSPTTTVTSMGESKTSTYLGRTKSFLGFWNRVQIR